MSSQGLGRRQPVVSVTEIRDGDGSPMLLKLVRPEQALHMIDVQIHEPGRYRIIFGTSEAWDSLPAPKWPVHPVDIVGYGSLGVLPLDED